MGLLAEDKRVEGRVFQLLLVEDNATDAELTAICLDRAGLRYKLSVVESGEQALAFLRRQTPYADAPVPDMVLLDLNLPGMNGFEVLTKIATDDVLRTLPVTILSTSADEADIIRAYHHRCNSYLTKAPNLEEMIRTMRVFVAYWFGAARLPRPPHTHRKMP